MDFGKVERAFTDLTFEWTARRGAVELADAYRAAGLTREDFDGDRFVRLRRIKHLLDDGVLDEELRRVVSKT